MKAQAIIADPVIFLKFDTSILSQSHNVITCLTTPNDGSSSNLFINGEPIKPAPYQNWIIAKFSGNHDKPIEKCQVYIKAGVKSRKYELVARIDGMVETYTPGEWDALDEKFKESISRFYDLKTEMLEPFFEDVSVELDVLCSVSGYKMPPSFGDHLTERGNKWYDLNDTPYVISKNGVAHNRIDRIMIPEPMLHETKAYILSNDLFEIIRQHIIKNIDSKVAKVTSNYDFVFSVSKTVDLIDPYESMSIGDMLSKKKKSNKRMIKVTQKSFSIMSITPEKHKYNNCTVVPDLNAENEEKLQEKLKNVLDRITAFVNTPIRQCPHCRGSGYLEEDTKALEAILLHGND